MAKRETIGKIQIVLGIILIVGAIVGGIYSYNSIQDEMESRITTLGGENPFKNIQFSSNETKATVTLSYFGVQFGTYFGYTNILTTIGCSLGIIGVLSIIMILQGLANIGDKK